VDIVAEFGNLIDAFSSANIDYAVCGGFAVNIYGHVRATRDIDFLVRAEQLAAAIATVKTLGFSIEAGVIPLGAGTAQQRELHRVTKIKGISAGLAQMKQLAGRPQDLADIDSLGLHGIGFDEEA
jgi:hypothetical protein